MLYSENKSLTDRFPIFNENCFDNNHIKYTVRGGTKINYLQRYKNPHSSFVEFLSCNTFGRKKDYDTSYYRPNFNVEYLAHYYTKTIKEFSNKILRGYPTHFAIHHITSL